MDDDNSFPIEMAPVDDEPRIDVNSFLPTDRMSIANVNVNISFSSDESETKGRKE
jgi:hypothetical protein